MDCCASSIGRKFPSTPTLPKTTSALVTKRENLRRNRERQRSRHPRYHAGARQDLHEAQAVVLRLLGFTLGPAQPPNPAPRRSYPPRSILTPRPEISPGYAPPAFSCPETVCWEKRILPRICF